MKKNIIIAIAVILFGIAGSVTAAGFYYPSSNSNNVASTTASYVLANGTVSKTIISDGIEQVSWLVAFASSSTPPTLSWTNFYSLNGTDWYAEDQTYASSTAHVSSEKVENWVYATSSATTILSNGSNGVTKFIGRRIVIPNLGTLYTKTIFTVTGANAMLDVRSATKNQVVISK